MNNELFTLFGKVAIKTDEVAEGLDGATEKAEEAAEGMVGKFKNAAKVIGGLMALDKVIDFGKVAVEAAASAQAMTAQFEQVFGDMDKKAQSTIDNMGKEFGIMPNRLKPGYTKLTSMFKGVGMEMEQAMGVAEQVTRSAADAAAFYDVSMEDAQSSLSSFIKGNYEAGESVGIFANDTQMAQYAIEQGVVSSTAEWQKLDEATKQATRADYITKMQEMAGATGQAARESDGLENVMGNVKQAWQDFLVVVGQPILQMAIPVLQATTTAITWLTTGVQNIANAYGSWAEKHPTLHNALMIFLGVLALGAAGFGIYSAATTIAATATAAFGAIMAIITSPITLTIAAIAALAAAIYLIYANWSSVGPMLSQIWTNISTWVTTTVSNMVTTVTTWFSNMWSSVTNFANNIKTNVSNAFTNAYNTVKQKVIDMFNAVKTWFGKIPSNIKSLWGQAESYLRGINLGSIGRSIVEGLWNGIKGKWGQMTAWVASKAKGIKDTIAGVLKINSPSKIMIPIGSAVPEGVAVGVDEGWSYIDDSIDNIGNKLANTSFNAPTVQSMDYNYKPQSAQIQANTNLTFFDSVLDVLHGILNKESNFYVNGRNLSEELVDDLNYINELRNNRSNRIGGVRV